MLVSDIGYLKPNCRVGMTENVNKTQSAKTNLTEGFGNYNKNNSYVLGKIKFFEYIKDSFMSAFTKESASDKPKSLSIIV